MPGPLGGCEVVREGVETLDFWTLGRVDPCEYLATEGVSSGLWPECHGRGLCSGSRYEYWKGEKQGSSEEIGKEPDIWGLGSIG